MAEFGMQTPKRASANHIPPFHDKGRTGDGVPKDQPKISMRDSNNYIFHYGNSVNIRSKFITLYNVISKYYPKIK